MSADVEVICKVCGRGVYGEASQRFCDSRGYCSSWILDRHDGLTRTATEPAPSLPGDPDMTCTDCGQPWSDHAAGNHGEEPVCRIGEPCPRCSGTGVIRGLICGECSGNGDTWAPPDEFVLTTGTVTLWTCPECMALVLEPTEHKRKCRAS